MSEANTLDLERRISALEQSQERQKAYQTDSLRGDFEIWVGRKFGVSVRQLEERAGEEHVQYLVNAFTAGAAASDNLRDLLKEVTEQRDTARQTMFKLSEHIRERFAGRTPPYPNELMKIVNQYRNIDRYEFPVQEQERE